MTITADQEKQVLETVPTQLYVGGEWRDASGGETLDVEDPSTGETIAAVADATEDDAQAAIDAAAGMQEEWARTPPRDRGEILRRAFEKISERKSELALLMTLEMGKPLAESEAEVAYAAEFFRWFAEEAVRIDGRFSTAPNGQGRLITMKQPVGPCYLITPWNFPMAMGTRKIGPAVAAGCTMIVKPAPETPLSALALAKLAEEAGMPPGVFQVLTGEAASLARRLLENTEVRAFSFTGSTEVGRILLTQSAATVKKASLELGGHAPFILFDDVDLAKSVKDCIAAKFATSGQDCLAANRIYVQRRAYDRFVDQFARATAELRVGHGLEPGTDIGPMTRASVAEKCRQQVAQAVSAGARLVCGGQDSPLGGNFVTPTVLADVTDDMLIAQEETFGPVAAILPFDDEAEVLARANATEMGLAAYLYTNDLGRAMRLTDRLEYGMVAVNTPKFTGAPIPFGGWKQSGLGREGSRHGLLEYLEAKYVCFGNLAA